MKSFFKEAIKSIKTTGSIKPSSKYLVRDCLKDLNLKDADSIIEFGSGNGCFTEEIVSCISEETSLFVFEINPTFYDYCKSKFTLNDNVSILNQSAFDVRKVLKENNIDKVDYIISSLPLVIFKEEERKILLNKIKSSLKKDGIFVQYQYSLGNFKEVKKVFSRVDLDLTIRNLPPAFIYKCSN